MDAASIGAPVASSTWPEIEAAIWAWAAAQRRRAAAMAGTDLENSFASRRVSTRHARVRALRGEGFGAEKPGAHPAGFPKFARRRSEDNFIAILIKRRLR